MTLRILIFFVVSILIGSVHAGSGTATLTCTSESGRTIFKAYLQDIEGMFEGGELEIDGNTISFPTEDSNSHGDIIWDPENGMLTVTFSHETSNGHEWFRFWSIPSTFKVISNERGSDQGAVYEFEGLIEATDPRPDKGYSTPRISLTCRLEYGI